MYACAMLVGFDLLTASKLLSIAMLAMGHVKIIYSLKAITDYVHLPPLVVDIATENVL